MLEDITLGLIYRSQHARDTVQDNVDKLAASILEIGLINPLLVRRTQRTKGIIPFDAFEIVAGHHRYAAVKQLKWKTVPCKIVEIDDLRAQMTEIDENLVRAGLSPAQEAWAITRRKELYEALHPETKATYDGGSFKGNQVTDKLSATTSFASATSQATGKCERTIRRAAARGRELGPELKQIEGTSLDKAVELDALAVMPAEQRRDLILRAKAGEKVSAFKEYKPAVANRQTTISASNGYGLLVKAWEKAGPEERGRFLGEVSEKLKAGEAL